MSLLLTRGVGARQTLITRGLGVLNLGDDVVDQFPVFADDGYTKISGLTSFTYTLWKDTVAQTIPVAFTEIGTSGEYRVSFTPDSSGFWTCEVLITVNHQQWYGEYTVAPTPLEFSASMGEDSTTASFTVWGESVTGRVNWLTSMSAKIHDAEGYLIADLGLGFGPTSDGTFVFNCLSSILAYNIPYYLAMTATTGGSSWNGNCGFVRVK
jgi:hypothetical protein